MQSFKVQEHKLYLFTNICHQITADWRQSCPDGGLCPTWFSLVYKLLFLHKSESLDTGLIKPNWGPNVHFQFFCQQHFIEYISK